MANARTILSLAALSLMVSFCSGGQAQEIRLVTPETTTQAAPIDPKAAVEMVSSVFTPNPLVKIEATGQPLPTNGSWSVQTKLSGEVPEPCSSNAMNCTRVMYRVPAVNVLCSWVVGFVTVTEQIEGKPAEPKLRVVVVSEDENAARYTLKKEWTPGDPPILALKRQAPVYPPIARAARVEGQVLLRLSVDPNGQVADVKVLSGPAILQQAARDAALNWKFKPMRIGNQTIAFQTQTVFQFVGGNAAWLEGGMGTGGTVMVPSGDPRHPGITMTGADGTRWVKCNAVQGCQSVAPPVPR